MAKDPAFLFYPGDWLGGTMTFTRHEKGCYMDLLMAQFHNGPLSLDTIKMLLGQDQAKWTVLQAKFKQNAAGLYYNEKLATEVEKRKAYTDSRSRNRNSKPPDITHDNTYVVHTSTRMENENGNVIELGKEGVGENHLIPVKIGFESAPPVRKSTRDILLMQDLKHLAVRVNLPDTIVMDELEYYSRVHARTAMKDVEIIKGFTNYLTNKHNKSGRAVSEAKNLEAQALESLSKKKLYKPTF